MFKSNKIHMFKFNKGHLNLKNAELPKFTLVAKVVAVTQIVENNKQ